MNSKIKNENLIKKLIDIREDLSNILKHKYEIMEIIKKDIDRITERIHEIDGIVSSTSIVTADVLMDTISFLEKNANKKINNIELEKKHYSGKETGKLMLDFKFDGSVINISFPHSKDIKLEYPSIDYIEYIVKPIRAVKDKEPDLKINIIANDDLGYITRIRITDVFEYENVEKIFEIFCSYIDFIENNREI